MPIKTKETWKFILALSLCGVATLGVAELLIRKLSEVELIYPLEMAKYARSLKQLDPLGKVSHIHIPNASATLMGVSVRLNSLGNRGKEPMPQGTKKVKRFLVLGSSVTMGWGVLEEETFTSRLEQKLNTSSPKPNNWIYEVNNAGIGNYNSEFQYELFKRQISQLKPDYVLLQYFISDAEKRPREKNNWIYKKSDLAVLLYDRLSSLKFHFSENTLLSFYDSLYAENSTGWQETHEIVKAMARECDAKKIPFWVMIIPDLHDLRANTAYAQIYEKIERQFKENKIETLNMFPLFSERFGNREKDLWVQPSDSHPNAQGHMLMAEAFFPFFLTRIGNR